MSEPVYLRVADALEAKISRRSPGSQLASENELAREYSISRLTARAALEELERRYLVRRAQGRGTFVAERLDYRVGPGLPPSWSETVRSAGGSPRVRTERLRSIAPGAAVREALRLPAGAAVYHLVRRRFLGDVLAGFAESWLAADAVPELADTLAVDGSLHGLLRDRYALDPVSGKVHAEFVIAPASIAAKLEREDRPMVFKLTGITNSRRLERPIQYTVSWLRADMFRVVFEMGEE